MTNKEFIQNEIDNLKSILAVAKDDNLKTIIKESEEDIEQYNQVLKDLDKLEQYEAIFKEPIMNIQKRLKVLEILKSYMNISSDGIISCHNLIVLPQCETYKEKYDLIKEWLENEK